MEGSGVRVGDDCRGAGISPLADSSNTSLRVDMEEDGDTPERVSPKSGGGVGGRGRSKRRL